MSSNIYSVGLNHVGAYQVSGVPYVSGSVLPNNTSDSIRFQFPSVTRKVYIRTFQSSNHEIRIHFAPYTAGDFSYTNGASNNSNYISSFDAGVIELEVKCSEIFLSAGDNNTVGGNVEVIAELTNIPAARMFSLDGVEGVAQ